uniref:Uncharacterized protein n=1 Tax=Cannabis sativa TaxID=3483 RepID=A0A803QH71_CANSA
MGLQNELTGNIGKNITKIKANTRAKMLSRVAKGKGKSKEKRASKSKASSVTPSVATLTSPCAKEGFPLLQLLLAFDMVFLGSSVPEPSQGGMEAIILPDESGEGYLFLGKVAQYLKRPDPHIILRERQKKAKLADARYKSPKVYQMALFVEWTFQEVNSMAIELDQLQGDKRTLASKVEEIKIQAKDFQKRAIEEANWMTEAKHNHFVNKGSESHKKKNPTVTD